MSFFPPIIENKEIEKLNLIQLQLISRKLNCLAHDNEDIVVDDLDLTEQEDE